jgi:hypothetical protein
MTESGVQNDDPGAPGWDAIDQALAPLYAGQEPRHYGTLIGYELGGPDPIRGISAYRRTDPVPHWHFITYGFSELFGKEAEDPEVSGWGFELTMRVTDDTDAEEPPAWVLNFLQNLGRYVFGSGNVFSDGDYLNANGPISLESETLLRAVAFTQDPELPPIDTPNGRVEFLQVVGITNDEEFALKQWKTRSVLEVFQEHLPLLVTDLGRASLLGIADMRERLAAGRAAEGSNTGFVFVDTLAWEEKKRLLRTPEVQLTIGAQQVNEMLGLLPYRLPFGKDFTMAGRECAIVFASGDGNRHAVDGTTLRLELAPDTLTELLSILVPREGEYRPGSFPGLVFQVRKTEIRDPEGNVIQVIG